MLTFAVLFAASAALPGYSLPPNKPARCSGACAERYRVSVSSDDGDILKKRAVRIDGSKCDVVGARRCTSKTRSILRSVY
ncbi:MAG: hypothetical protein E7773_02615 [Sphingomonas sp.]|uniref:hypothetical protein n=1 Tax=Sphingomonas sp. TaxID=28214 RepID=UPI001207B6DB|nr:hypothetical protein [Sphingomonas sp.]THD37889.1 MAG: hypothetical protein E7773_02615 [Sphingomonas sp.]